MSLLRTCSRCETLYDSAHDRGDGLCPRCASGNCNHCGENAAALRQELDVLREAAAAVLHFLCVDSDDGSEYLTIGAITDNREGGQVERVKALRDLVAGTKAGESCNKDGGS